MSKLMDLEEFSEMIKEYQQTTNETIELKVNLVADLLKKIEENDIKIQILLVQKYNLVIELKKRGLKPDEIRKILDIRKDK